MYSPLDLLQQPDYVQDRSAIDDVHHIGLYPLDNIDMHFLSIPNLYQVASHLAIQSTEYFFKLDIFAIT
jgi:hypothetical protein